jgi:hypothetical protein
MGRNVDPAARILPARVRVRIVVPRHQERSPPLRVGRRIRPLLGTLAVMPYQVESVVVGREPRRPVPDPPLAQVLRRGGPQLQQVAVPLQLELPGKEQLQRGADVYPGPELHASIIADIVAGVHEEDVHRIRRRRRRRYACSGDGGRGRCSGCGRGCRA